LAYLSLLAVVSPLSTLFISTDYMLDSIYTDSVDPRRRWKGIGKVGWKESKSESLGLSVAERLWRESLEIPMINFEGGTSLEPV